MLNRYLERLEYGQRVNLDSEDPKVPVNSSTIVYNIDREFRHLG